MDTSNQEDSRTKSDQLILQFISKTAQTIVQSRLNLKGSKRNKWVLFADKFNLELEDIDSLREEMKFWKGQIPKVPPLVVEILLEVSVFKPKQDLLLTNSKTGRRHRIDKEVLMTKDHNNVSVQKTKILLESWQLSMAPTNPTEEELSSIYKKCIIFFRTLYSYVRLMPCFLLCKRINRKQSPCRILYRVGTARTHSPYEAGLDELHVTEDMRLGIAEQQFQQLETSTGYVNLMRIFNLHVAYRVECEFAVDDSEITAGKYGDLEPEYFNVLQVAKRNSLDQATSQPSESIFIGPNKSKNASIIHAGSLNRNTPSPENNFRFGTAPSRSIYSEHFFPPRDDAPFPIHYSQEELPFSNGVKPPERKSLYQSEYSASPPFAKETPESFGSNRSLSMARQPSLIFPSSPAAFNLTPPAAPLLFASNSSLSHHFLKTLKQKSSASSPNEVENLLSVIEHTQASERLNFPKNLIISGSKESDSLEASNILSRFRKMKIQNDKLAELVRDFKVNTDEVSPNPAEEVTNPAWSHKAIPDSSEESNSAHARRNSIAFQFEKRDRHEIQTKVLSRSESNKKTNRDDDEDLLFNMSMME